VTIVPLDHTEIPRTWPAFLPFSTTAFRNGEFVEVSDADVKGKWAIFFFYPADFTFVCPTELGDLADHYEELKGLGVEVYSVSTDTHFVHKAWHDASDTIGKITYTMLGDANGTITNNFGVMRPGPAWPIAPPSWSTPTASSRPWRSPPRASAATPPSSSARCAPPSTSASTRARSARPSGKRAPTPSPRRSTSSARSDELTTCPGGGADPAPPRLPGTPPPNLPDPYTPWSRLDPMLDAALADQLKTHLTKVTEPVELVSSLDDSPKSHELAELLDQVAGLSDKITVVPSRRRRASPLLRHRAHRHRRLGAFAGIPLGHEFTSFVLALLQVGGHPSTADERSSSRSAASRAPTSSRRSSRCRARTAPTWCRRST
jgi:peroxiredoxin